VEIREFSEFHSPVLEMNEPGHNLILAIVARAANNPISALRIWSLGLLITLNDSASPLLSLSRGASFGAPVCASERVSGCGIRKWRTAMHDHQRRVRAALYGRQDQLRMAMVCSAPFAPSLLVTQRQTPKPAQSRQAKPAGLGGAGAPFKPLAGRGVGERHK
jgi:hypothetical protein